MKTKKILLSVLALALVAVVSVVGTLAYLQDKSGEVKNTFTVGNITIELHEHELKDDGLTVDTDKVVEANDTYKLIPGRTAEKDPFVVVKKGSEKCWVYVGVNKENNTITGLEGEVAQITPNASWVEVGTYTDEDGKVYTVYAAPDPVNALEAENDVNVTGFISNVTINENLTAEQITAMGDDKPALNFLAFAVQSEGFDDAQAAWNATYGA